jgi:predicted O-methyltransferase YrrM
MIISKLKELEKESISRNIPIIGSEKGTWLYNKILELKPKKILELGTANGYSGIILGSEGAKLTTIELNSKIIAEAKSNFKKFNINAKIINGDGVKEIKKLNEKYDLIFIDFIKKEYITILEDCIRLGKYIIADNINFKRCKNFKEKILNHPKLKTEIINIKDGLSFSKKN